MVGTAKVTSGAWRVSVTEARLVFEVAPVRSIGGGRIHDVVALDHVL